MKNQALFFLWMSCIISCAPKKESKNIFRINQVAGIESLDPAFAKNLNIMWHTQNLYNRLIEFDKNKKPIGSLAKNWEISPDRKTYIFNLRTDVFFHDNEAFAQGKGRKMTAHDVVFSYSRLVDDKVASPGSWVFNGHIDEQFPFSAINDSTFVLKLNAPFNPILGILSMQYCSIVPKEVVEKWGKDFRSHPCGTGPFQFQHWEESVVVTYLKNKNYWEKDSLGKRLPYLDGIKISFIDSKASEFLMFMQGNIDFMNGIDVSFKDQVLDKKGNLKNEYKDKITLQKNPYLNVEYLGILQNENGNEFLKNKKIRQAINFGFDRKKLVTYLRNNIGMAANAGIIPTSLAGFDSNLVKGYDYNPEKAKKIIAEVKKETQKPIKILLQTPDNYTDRCSFIASQLQEIGIEVQIEILQPNILREQMSNSKSSFFWATWIADYPDADSYLSLFYSKNSAPPNYTRFNNKAFDKLYEQSLTIENEEEKLHLFHQMDNIIVEEAPCVPLFYDEVVHFLQKNVRGFKTNNLNLLDWKTIYF
ncbi:MAG: ABC transporter substrate-binding protein [Chitinophagaceae bacterium]|nr:ABC transporter substrate-binding protein [Chitinophagaceae bacterium]